MRPEPQSLLGTALAHAIAAVRHDLADPTAAVGILVPSDATGVLLRQQLALAGPFIRVEFLTPERLVRDLARPHFPAGWAPEPAAWLPTAVGVLLQRLANDEALGPHGDALRQPGWRHPVARAIERLESAGLDPAHLAGFEDPTLAQRAEVLATVLIAVRERRALDRLLALSDQCALALQALRTRGHGPGHRIAGAVLVGDRILSPDAFGVVQAWLQTRPHRVLNPVPLAHLDPAPRGLRAAATGPVDSVTPTATGALGAIQARLYRPQDPEPVAIDPSLAMVTTPDEVRDATEAVREVLSAIRDGVPLDRIAIVLPDTRQADVLQAALDRAGVPTTWLIGPSLDRAPEARGLLLAVEIADGQDSVRQWHALLSHPALDLRRALGAEATTGRGRWRRILGDCGAVRGTHAILDAVESWSAGLEVDQDEDRAAGSSLLHAMRALEATFSTWREPSTLGAHAERFAAFAARWWRPSARRERVLVALEDWGSPAVGFRISLSQALAELVDTLASAADLDGKMTEPKVRVLSPMLCLGGAFERLCVTGLTHKRLPTEIREDPLLPDALLNALAARHGVTLLTSRVLADFEARRFAAIVGACTGRLWLSSPQLEMLTERPLLPSSHLLAVQSVLSGHRAGFAELRRTMTRSGSRAHPFASDPAQAIGALEHGIATARKDPPGRLAHLAAQPATRRLLALHRALDTDAPTAWTGRVSPELLHIAGLDDDAFLSASDLRSLLLDPADFFFRRILRAYPAKDLPESWDPTDRRVLGDSVRAAIREAVEGGDASVEAVWSAWAAAMDETAAHNPHVDEVDLRIARRLARANIEGFCRAAGPLVAEVSELTGQPFADLPWQVDSSGRWLGTDAVVGLQYKTPTQVALPLQASDLVLTALLAMQQGRSAGRIAVYDGDGSSIVGTMLDCAPEVHDRATVALALVRGGWLPWATDGDRGARLRAELADSPWEPERVAAVFGEEAS